MKCPKNPSIPSLCKMSKELSKKFKVSILIKFETWTFINSSTLDDTYIIYRSDTQVHQTFKTWEQLCEEFLKLMES